MSMKAMESVSVKTVTRLSVILLWFSILSGCGYYHARFGSPTLVVEESKMKFMVESDLNISLNALPGELVIKGIDSDYAEASMEVKCPEDISSPCADHFAGLEFAIRREGNELTISTNRKALLSSNSVVITTLALPRIEHLKVNMLAGNANFYGIDVAQLDVNMKAGNVDIYVNKVETLKVAVATGNVNIVIPENIVAEIDLDAKAGGVSIRRPGGFEKAPQSFFGGAEMKKFISNEGATVNADVQYGKIRLNLIP